jgi:transposase
MYEFKTYSLNENRSEFNRWLKQVRSLNMRRRNAMGRSNGVTISVKIPINWDLMTRRSRQRLRQITGRDTRVIRSFLGVIEQNESELLTGRNKKRIDEGILDKLTIVALRTKPGYEQRPSVPHDLKKKFPRISANELSECRRTAVGMYESYLALRSKRGRSASRPCVTNATRRIPRWVFKQRFKLIEKEDSFSKWWIDLRDSFEIVSERPLRYARILIPLKMSPFHLNQINRGTVQALQIFKDMNRKWWMTLAIRVSIPEISENTLPPAVLGIDLGLRKAACTTLVAPEKVRETRYFVQKEKVRVLAKYDERVAKLQHVMDNRRNNDLRYDRLTKKLRSIRSKREDVSKDYDHVLVRELVDYILELSKKYTLYVAIGKLKNIRVSARKYACRSRRFRSMVHSWAFSRITESLGHQLAQLGWKTSGRDSRFRVVPESWTSIMCWKCGNKGKRPKQSFFLCPSCGHKTNADRNGAINIAGRLITLTKSLHSVRGLGKWASAIARSTRPKSRWKSSRGKSLLSTKGDTSHPREFAVVHTAQMSLLDFVAKSKECDNDPAVERTVENLTAVEIDASKSRQEKEARSVDGVTAK